jgi:TldD protein
VLADIFTHKVDYADLYFQYTRNEAWSLEEGIVKSGSFSIDQGVGVRAVSGDKTAFAYSDDISRRRWEAAAATRTIAARRRARQGGGSLPRTRAAPVPPNDPLDSLTPPKVALLERSKRWRAPRIRAWCR